MSGKGSYGDKRRKEKMAKKKNSDDPSKITYPTAEQFYAIILANQGSHFDCITADKTIYICKIPKRSALNVKPGILIAISDPGIKRGAEVVGSKKNGVLCISYTQEAFDFLHSNHPDLVPWDPRTGEIDSKSSSSRSAHGSTTPAVAVSTEITDAMTAPIHSIAETSASTADIDIDALLGDI